MDKSKPAIRCGGEEPDFSDSVDLRQKDQSCPGSPTERSESGANKQQQAEALGQQLTQSLAGANLQEIEQGLAKLAQTFDTAGDAQYFNHVVKQFSEEAKKYGISVSATSKPDDVQATLRLQKDGDPTAVELTTEAAIDMAKGSLKVEQQSSTALVDAQSGNPVSGSAAETLSRWVKR